MLSINPPDFSNSPISLCRLFPKVALKEEHFDIAASSTLSFKQGQTVEIYDEAHRKDLA